MDPSKQKEHVAHVETFNVDDPLEDDIEKPSMAKQASDVGMKDGDKPAASGQAYCQFKIDLDRKTFNELHKHQEAQPKKQNTDVLVFFADKSGSMSGKPLQTVKDGLINLADTIFGETEEDNAFAEVHTVWFDNGIFPHVTSKKEAYLKDLREDKPMGGTDFYPCFKYIDKLLKASKDGTRFSIVFLTDGQGSYDKEKSCPNLKNLCTQLARENDKHCAIYSLGFSQYHDAQLLNGLAQSGSELGNFIYIPFEGDIMAKMKESLESSLSMALGARGQRLILTNSLNKEFKISRAVRADYSFAEEEVKKPQADQIDTGEAMIDEGDEQKPDKDGPWITVTYSMATLVANKDLQSSNLVLTLSLGDEIELTLKPIFTVNKDVSHELRATATLDVLNRLTFDLIQRIQQQGLTADDRKKCLNQLSKIDDALNTHKKEFLKIPERSIKKKLVAQVMDKKMETAKVLNLLRGIQDLSHLPNDIIAQINDVAYKAVQTNQLQKMLDKRALVNEERYQKLDSEIDQIVEKLDLDKLRKKHAEIVEDIGSCALSCMDVCDALEMGDAMCIGLEVEKPEAAIADPSRLKIKNIVPTYTTSESFLQSAKFNLSQNSRSHGSERQPLMKGVGNENINGIMPLYLFDEHWWLAKRKISPVLGFMVTDDVLGFTSEQLHTVPFLVLIRALEQQQETPSASNLKILEIVLETCKQMIRHNKVLRRIIAQQVHAFAYQPNNVSSRTADVVKAVKVLAAQFMCLCLDDERAKHLGQCEDLSKDIIAFFTDQKKRGAMGTRFYRAAAEEQMRGFVDEGFSTFFLEALDKYLLKDVDKFIETTFDRRAKELDEEIKRQTDDKSKDLQYAKIADDIRSKYDQKIKTTGDVAEESKEQAVEEAKKIDFDEEIATYLQGQSYVTGESSKLVEKVIASYDEKAPFKQIRLIAETTCRKENGFKNMRAMPGFGDLSDDDFYLVILGIVVQNAHHKDNKQRVVAVKEGRYTEILAAKDARNYLNGLLSKKLMETLKQKESAIVKKTLGQKMNIVIDKVVAASDAFTAAAIAKINGMLVGRGDFHKAIVKICESDAPIADLHLKLAFLKTGHFLQKSLLDKPITDEVIASLTEDQAMKIASDKGGRVTAENHCVTAKHVFKLWAKHVYVGKTLSQEQIENLFPEFVERLQLYGKCCDETGKAVRNLDVYKAYRSTPHQFRPRGLKKDFAQKKAKRAFAKKRDDAKKAEEAEAKKKAQDEAAQKKSEHKEEKKIAQKD